MNSGNLHMKTMIKGRKRPSQQLGFLKTMLFIGAALATLLGTRLLAIQDESNETAVFESKNSTSAVQPSPTISGIGNKAIILDLAPVPQAYSPEIQIIQRTRPIARTRTS